MPRALPGSVDKKERKELTNKVRALVFPLQKATNELFPDSKQIDLEKWDTLYRTKIAIEPPYDPETLAQLGENCSIIIPCIDAMKTNIDSFRHHYVSRFGEVLETPSKEQMNIMSEEKSKLQNFFNVCCFDYSFTELRQRTRIDLESTGNAYWEILRKRNGTISGIRHIPSHSMRLTGKQRKAFLATRQFVVWNEKAEDFEFKKITTAKRFRMFIQRMGVKTVFFKEFGDPRIYDCRNGDEPEEGKKVSYKYQSNEIIHFRIYSARTAYGIPRYIGNLFSVFGSRQADEVNFTTLSNNQIPSMILMVSNGQLTESSVDRIKEFAERKMAQQKNFSQIMVLEAEPATEALGEPASGNMRMEIKPLTKDQIHDAMFVEYDKNNLNKIRRSWRLPPIVVGDSQDYTRATADASLKFADEQIFNPERDSFDWIINFFIFPELGIKYTKFKSNTPNVTNDQDLIRLLGTGERTGGLSPQIARDIISDIMGRDFGKIKAENLHPDVPMTIQVAERAKQTGPVNQGTIAGIKRPSLYREIKTDDDVKEFIDKLVVLRDEIKTRYKLEDGEGF